MKASDLRIGNLYESTDGSGFVKATAKDLYAWESGAIYGKPIQLTEDWLRKAGFEVEYESSFTRTLSIDGDSSSFRYRYALQKGIEHLEYCGKTTKCEHVHQLQNLYHALTGEELTFDL